MRTCLNCSSTTTYVDRFGYEHWRHYEDGYLCNKCYNRLVGNPKYNPMFREKWNAIINTRKLRFKGKFLFLKENPRKGICSLCGKVGGRTAIHHIHYHDDDPLKDTVELCVKCHNKQHPKLRNERGQFI